MKGISFYTPRLKYYSLRHDNLRRAIKSVSWRKAKIVLYTTPYTPMALLHMFLSSIFGKIVVLNFVYSIYLREIEEHEYRDPIAYWMERLFLSAANLIIVDTHSFRKIYSRIFKIPMSKIEVLHGFTDMEVFEPLEVEKSYDIVYHGTFVRNHGLDTLVEFADQHRDLKFKYLMIGDNPVNQTRQRLKDLVSSLGLQDQFDFVGGVPMGELKYHINKAKYGVGSLAGSFKAGSVLRSGLIEIMACGLVPITANSYETQKNMKLNHIQLLEPDSPKAIYEFISSLEESQGQRYSMMASEAREYVVSHFSLESVAEKFDLMLQKLEHQFSLECFKFILCHWLAWSWPIPRLIITSKRFLKF